MTNNIVGELKPQKEDRQAPPKTLKLYFYEAPLTIIYNVRWITSEGDFLRIVSTDSSEGWYNSKDIESLELLPGKFED
jgi:hypothetical protein